MIRVMTRRSAGFSLIEALVGLTLIGLTLLVTMSLLAQQPRIEHRLKAHHEVLRMMESQLERLRSDLVRPVKGEEAELTEPPWALRMEWSEVEIQGPKLYEVELLARYRVREKAYEMRIRTMIFNPRYTP